MELSDIVGLGSAIKTVVEAISNATSALYRPYGIRREAKADADAIGIKARAKAQALIDQHNLLEAAGLQLMPPAHPPAPPPLGALGASTTRLAHVEQRRQSNMAAVADGALALLLQRLAKGAISAEQVRPPDPDWLVYLMELCKDVGNEEVQELWQKILAGEFEQPGSYSLSTLNTLRHLSAQDARSFGKLAEYVWVHTETGFLHYIKSPAIDQYLTDRGLSTVDRQELDAIGLIAGPVRFDVWKTPADFTYLGATFRFSRKDTEGGIGGIAGILETERLSRVGQQLYQLCKPAEPDTVYITTLSTALSGPSTFIAVTVP